MLTVELTFLVATIMLQSSSDCLGCHLTFKPVDGGWTAWRDTGTCSTTCGRGSIVRLRSCDNPKPQNGGKGCVGQQWSFTFCQKKPCPVDGKWSNWSPYSECAVTCGFGTQTSTRTCSNPKPQYGGENCTGNSTQTRRCPYLPSCAVDGQWGEWTSFSLCSKSCGTGYKNRTRTCTHPPPTNGGAPCVGAMIESLTCSTQKCPDAVVDGGWSAWNSPTKCSTTCGAGSQVKIRKCNNPTPSNGGKPCVGNIFESVHCMIKPCPVPTVHSKTTPMPTTKTHAATTSMIDSAYSTSSTKDTTEIREVTHISSSNENVIDKEELSSIPSSVIHEHTTSTTSRRYPSHSSSIPLETTTPGSHRPQIISTLTTDLPKQTTSIYSNYPNIKLDLGIVSLGLVLYIDKSFDDRLLNKSSPVYFAMKEITYSVLLKKFSTIIGFKKITVNAFSYGSIRVNYSVDFDATKLAHGAPLEKSDILDKALHWTVKDYKPFDAPINLQKTSHDIGNINITEMLYRKIKRVCTCHNSAYKCVVESGYFTCRHLCMDKKCGQHGKCFVDSTTKTPKCFCDQNENGTVVYYGDECQKTKLTEQNPEKKSDMTVIAVSVGVCGSLLFIILIVLICVCKKWRDEKETWESTYSKCGSLFNAELENGPRINDNLYFTSSSKDNPVYTEDSLENQTEPYSESNKKQEQILRIYLHVENSQTPHNQSVLSATRTLEDQHVYIDGNCVQRPSEDMNSNSNLNDNEESNPQLIPNENSDRQKISDALPSRDVNENTESTLTTSDNKK